MKKLLVLALVLSMATVASAALTLGVSDTELLPSDNAVISLTGVDPTPMGTYYLGFVGLASFDLGSITIPYAGSDKGVAFDDGTIAGMLGLDSALIVSLADVPAPGTNPILPLGLVVDNIILHCNGAGDVLVSLFDGDGILLDSRTISQTPEPITVGLLGLGAMFLRRRK